jgi:hypothetical protein
MGRNTRRPRTPLFRREGEVNVVDFFFDAQPKLELSSAQKRILFVLLMGARNQVIEWRLETWMFEADEAGVGDGLRYRLLWKTADKSGEAPPFRY